MAASLVTRYGRVAAFKAVSQQAWGVRSMPSLYLCTKPGNSKKGIPKVARPSPETAQETHDISTYKNLQHHEYQPFTFVDFDVLLSKFRLPQPSSGRLSPRH
ncbi:NADH dehydrogenase [ubiquinone] flavoprotein 3, mitochondrial isoform X1 [Thamnophis elegans]|uniref:NADH dehydrogenase [ubiquinone] flavoprotein 3, mitochondrial isoform X1 n=1 Tax=Thamnophis elegans TaxID=35005 RepID=UPI0013773060|nr:NADH dehydrogenase [ubiquinone] flavoprotein 3, mitochondrial isoform X1 [Thamnophis elegans]